MDYITKLNPLIIEQIRLSKIPENMKRFLEEILLLESEKMQKNDDRFRADYERLVESFFTEVKQIE